MQTINKVFFKSPSAQSQKCPLLAINKSKQKFYPDLIPTGKNN